MNKQYLKYLVMVAIVVVIVIILRKFKGSKDTTKYNDELDMFLTNTAGMTTAQRVAYGIQLMNSTINALKESNQIAEWLRNDIAIAQALVETGNFSSPIFRENKNLFGMKQAFKRQTTATGTSRSHATYDSYSDSIKDYFYWLNQWSKTKVDRPFYNRNNPKLYLEAIANTGYAEAPNYVQVVWNTYEKIKNLI